MSQENLYKILKATIHNDLNFIKELKEFYPDMHWKDIRQQKTGETALHLAAEGGHIELLQHLLNAFPKDSGLVNIRTCDYRTPLHFAAQHCQWKAAEYLITQGADVNAVKRGDWTPLASACTKTGEDAVKTVSVLLEHKASIGFKNKDGWTPLMLACRAGELKICKLIISTSPQMLHNRTNTARTPLHIACYHGHLGIVQEIYSHLGHIPQILNKKDNCGTTPFHDAVLSGNVELVRYLVQFGVPDIFQTNNEGWNVLHMAAGVGHNRMVEYLINELFFSPNCLTEDKKRLTPLHCAAYGQFKNTMELLCSLKADDSIVDWQGRTAQNYYENVCS